MLELKPEQLAQIRADIAARKAMPDYGQSVAGNMERLRVIADTRGTFSTEMVEMLVMAIDEQEVNRVPVPKNAGHFVRYRSRWNTPSIWSQWTECSAEDYAGYCKLIAADGIQYGRIFEACILYDAPPAPAVPDGFKLVPTVPTPEMIAAAMNCDDVTFINLEDFCVNFGNIYAAMLAAVPEGRSDD